MIYTPKHFAVTDVRIVHEIIRRYNFGTLISIRDGAPVISHLPFVLVPDRGEKGALTAHMARANPQWRSFQPNVDVTAVFQGPHAYVSPRWYQPEPDNVPTWNYAVVHAHGCPKVIEDEEAAFREIGQMVRQHDPGWTLELSGRDRQELMRQIVVFEIGIERLEAKFKLSQNRPDGDADRVAAELEGSRDQSERETGALMRRIRGESVS